MQTPAWALSRATLALCSQTDRHFQSLLGCHIGDVFSVETSIFPAQSCPAFGRSALGNPCQVLPAAPASTLPHPLPLLLKQPQNIHLNPCSVSRLIALRRFSTEEGCSCSGMPPQSWELRGQGQKVKDKTLPASFLGREVGDKQQERAEAPTVSPWTKPVQGSASPSGHFLE